MMSALDLFIARMLDHPEFADKLRAMVLPAYNVLLRKLGASKGESHLHYSQAQAQQTHSGLPTRLVPQISKTRRCAVGTGMVISSDGCHICR